MPVPAAHVSSRRRFVLMTTTPAPMEDELSRVAATAQPLAIAARATTNRKRALAFRITIWNGSAGSGRDLSYPLEYVADMTEQPTPAEDEGEEPAEDDADERAEAPDRDERTVTESGGYGTPERGRDE